MKFLNSSIDIYPYTFYVIVLDIFSEAFFIDLIALFSLSRPGNLLSFICISTLFYTFIYSSSRSKNAVRTV